LPILSAVGGIDGGGRKAGIGENKTWYLPYTEYLHRRQEAIRRKDPACAIRLPVEKPVSGVVNDVVLLVDDPHGELEWIAALGALHPGSPAPQVLEYAIKSGISR
jgi:hypothetical protein